MKILSIHADHIEYEATKKAIKSAEDVEKEKTKVKDCLVIFTAVEKKDESNPEVIAEKLAQETQDIAKQVKADTIVLYPYAHLSSDLSSPENAIDILKKAEIILKKHYKVFRAPFGWYKSFEIKAKGHPLSELSREFSVETEKTVKVEENEAVKKEQTLKSFWHILDMDGTLYPIEQKDGRVNGFDFKKHKNLNTFSSYEIAKVRTTNVEPAHVGLMRKLELVDYEEGSDPGNLRYYPKGRLIKSLMERYVTEKTVAYGGMEIESPVMYDYEHPALKSYLNRFPARQYTIQTPNKKTFLRFAACFGQFLMAKDATISYKNLPLRLYELTRYSFRVEQRGELAGLRRLRAFTMPDCHALCADIQQAKEEMKKRFVLAQEITAGLGIPKEDFEIGMRVTKEFYEKEKDFLMSLIQNWGKPVLLEMWNDRFFYFIFKYEFNYVDSYGKATALSTDQMDVENAERYGMMYTDKDGKKKYPLVLHLSPSGAIERDMFVLLEKAAHDQKTGKQPSLPLWLSPTQIRIIPVNTSHLKFAEALAESMSQHNVRVDVDDNDETIGKRIRTAEQEWIPYIVVIGEKEIESKQLMTRIRATGKQELFSEKELLEKIHEETKGMPFQALPLPVYLTKRPIFVG
jgi:threonyl-tRNA synthetase